MSATSEITAVATEESPSAHRVVVTVAAARVNKAFDKAFQSLQKQAQVKGFRPGKAPRGVLQRMYGASVAEEIEQTLVQETIGDAIEQTSLEPVSTPSVEASPPAPDAEFSYTAIIEVKPPIALPELEGLPGKRPAVTVGLEEIETELERLRQQNAPVVEQPEGTAAETGHILSLDFVGRVDGEVFEGGTGRDVEIEIGAGRFVPGFEEQLVGACPGDDREVNISFPDDYGNAELAGKDASFQVHVGEVKKRQVPDLDDEFAKDLGEFETLDELRDRIRNDMSEQRESAAKSALHTSLVDALIERTEFDVPPGVTERQLEQRLRTAVGQLHGQVPEEALRGQIDRWREEWRPEAERDVRESWLLQAVAEAQDIEIDETVVAERLDELATNQGATADQLRETYGDDLGVSVARDLARSEALDFLVAAAKVEETTDS